MEDKIIIDSANEADLPSIKNLLSELIEAVEDAAIFDVERSIENCRALMKDPAHIWHPVWNRAGLHNLLPKKPPAPKHPDSSTNGCGSKQPANGIGKMLIQQQ